MKPTFNRTTDAVDFVDLVKIFNEVFEQADSIPTEEYLAKLLKKPNFIVMVARNESEIIGGLTVYVLDSYYDEKPTAFIYDVGVKLSFQGKGIGQGLISFLCEYCEQNGFRDAFVEAESDDINAVSFYRKTNFSDEMQTTQFTYRFGDEEK